MILTDQKTSLKINSFLLKTDLENRTRTSENLGITLKGEKDITSLKAQQTKTQNKIKLTERQTETKRYHKVKGTKTKRHNKIKHTRR